MRVTPTDANPCFGPNGRFELQPLERRLLVDGQPASLGARAFDLLLELAAHPGQLRTKSELIETVWAGTVVEEGNLATQISALRKVLGSELIATIPGRGYRFAARLDIGPAPAMPPAAATPMPAPVAPTPAPFAPAPAPAPRPAVPERLFGRDADLAELESLLHAGESACVTLAGTAGVGKSSLARVAMARWPARAAWIDLAPLSEGTQVAGAVARGLQAQPDDAAALQQLQRTLPAGSAMLLVLDNAEHVVDATAALVTQLGGFRHLRLLVTSQLPLSVRGEWVQRLSPLSLVTDTDTPPSQPAAPPHPDDAADTAHTNRTAAVAPAAATLLGDGALALLVERITAVDRRFTVTPAVLPLLSTICTQLDGLPLALEMAAARVPLMGLRAVHDHLAQRFDMLTGGRRDAAARHRTLHAALDWSYRLLSPEEQQLFRALGVFAGGFTLELALAVVAGSEGEGEGEGEHWDIVDRLATLTDRSLVSVSADDPPRYRMLETMRAYALVQLAASPQDKVPALRGRHAAALLALLERHPSDALCLAEMENVREAFAWARQHELALAARLSAQAVDLATFTVWRLETTEWMRSLEPVMAAQLHGPPGEHPHDPLPPALRANWWTTLALSLNQHEDPAALAAARQAVELWRGLQQPLPHQQAVAQWVRAITQPGAELDAACAELMGVTALLAATPQDELRMQGALAKAAFVRGDWPAELACREAELKLSREMRDPQRMQAAESNVCLSLTRVGRSAEAAVRGRQLLTRLDADGGDANGNLPWALNALIKALTEIGELSEAQALVPRALAACRRFDTSTAWPSLLLLAVAQRRFHAAARLLGYLRHLEPQSFDHEIEAQFVRAQAACVAALGEIATDALMMRGALLEAEAAQAEAAGRNDG